MPVGEGGLGHPDVRPLPLEVGRVRLVRRLAALARRPLHQRFISLALSFDIEKIAQNAEQHQLAGNKSFFSDIVLRSNFKQSRSLSSSGSLQNLPGGQKPIYLYRTDINYDRSRDREKAAYFIFCSTAKHATFWSLAVLVNRNPSFFNKPNFRRMIMLLPYAGDVRVADTVALLNATEVKIDAVRIRDPEAQCKHADVQHRHHEHDW